MRGIHPALSRCDGSRGLQAAYHLGMAYQMGDRVERNPRQALRFLAMAAEAGHPVVTPRLLSFIGGLVEDQA